MCGSHGGCMALQNSVWIEKDLDRVGPTIKDKSVETLQSKSLFCSILETFLYPFPTKQCKLFYIIINYIFPRLHSADPSTYTTVN